MLKQVLFSLIFVLIIGTANGQSNAETLKAFVADTKIELGELDPGLPIGSIADVFKETAAESFSITPETIANAIKSAEDYELVFIIVDDHTIVKITDSMKRQASGYWKTKVPFGEAYIQKAQALTKKEDYINNLLGVNPQKIKTMFVLVFVLVWLMPWTLFL